MQTCCFLRLVQRTRSALMIWLPMLPGSSLISMCWAQWNSSNNKCSSCPVAAMSDSNQLGVSDLGICSISNIVLYTTQTSIMQVSHKTWQEQRSSRPSNNSKAFPRYKLYGVWSSVTSSFDSAREASHPHPHFESPASLQKHLQQHVTGLGFRV